ncbi:unnamed protein product [Agarophyton chilense]|eukprot:gb/GEZJ01004294.1/.p1 GENE.gb/GEZJ01004294.1/~~gb/GEZJ01004294.1/.p1  ORF type:complete len:511 (-),score=68.54 gb/GEZJ01004294.1/:1299-2684(-)
MPSAFRSGRLAPRDERDRDTKAARHSRRGRGRMAQHHPASRTMDLGKLGRDEELGIHDGLPAQLRSGGFASFFARLFRKNDYSTRPAARYADMRRADGVASSGRLGRHAAASSLGSLQSYATSTIRASSGPIHACLTPASTSEVGIKKRVFIRKEDESQPVFSCQVRGKTLMSARPERLTYPDFKIKEFGGRDTWYSDVFVLPHNAIRWEIMDLYTILSSIQRRWFSITLHDIAQLAEYWQTFEVFVAQYFEIEDQIVFSFMQSAAEQSSEWKKYYMVVHYNRKRLESMLMSVGSTFELFNTCAHGEVLPKVYQALCDFLPKLLDYMEQQEEVLPNVFRECCEQESRVLLNRATANFIVRAANGRDGIAILTRWIEDSMILQIWKDENLSARAQSSHRRWIMNLEASHVEIARRFQRRLRTMPKQNGEQPSGAMEDRVESTRKSASRNSFKNQARRTLQLY